MSQNPPGGANRRAAQALGLKAPVYDHLAQSLAAGEYPLWLRSSDPILAGQFRDPFAFELLCERVELESSFDRRCDNLRRAIEKAEKPELLPLLETAQDEGDLEDIGFSLEPSAAPEGSEVPEDETLAEYLQGLRSNHAVASALRAAFRESGQMEVAATGKDGVELAPFQSLIGSGIELKSLAAAKYLQVRRGERAHAIQVSFDLPTAAIHKVAEEVGGYPPQERDRYLQLFVQFVRAERLPRLVQEARATLKRTAETEALRNGWESVDFAINRGRHNGPVLGLCSSRGGKVQGVLIDAEGEYSQGVVLAPKSDELEAQLRKLLGNHRPELVAYQGDTASRNLAQKLTKLIPQLDETPAPVQAAPAETAETTEAVAPTAEPESAASATEASAPAEAATPAEPEKAAKAPKSKGGDKAAAKSRVRQAHIPISVARTMMREVARRGAETLLSHDERQAFLVARFAADPRGAALQTPHVVRAFISHRSEVNPRRLEEFEVTFLRSLLVERGVDLNEAPLEVLRMVPGLDAHGTMVERSTGAFLSTEDYLDRMGPSERDARASMCLARVRQSSEILDQRAVHPIYYRVLHQLVDEAGMEMAQLLRDPAKINDLNWEPVLAENGWHKAVVSQLRFSLDRQRRRRRPSGAPGGQAGGGKGGPRRSKKGLDTLEVGSKLTGRVTSVMNYGAFVDIGVRTEGLVHISEMADDFVKDPNSVLQVGQEVEARIVSVDLEKQRFRLSLRSSDAPRGGGRDREDDTPDFVRRTRPKGRPGGAGRGRNDRDGGREKRGKREDYGKDPRAQKKEEIDPTNPFFQFFQTDDK